MRDARGRFVRRLKVGSLFSGVGGLDLAVEAFFGATTAWHCEFDPEPSKVLAARWPGVPNLGDVTAVDWSQVEPVDILCGGFPCQDLSLAGRRAGMRPGTRSGLWSDFVRAIRELKPKVVVIENVRGLLSGCAESASDGELGLCPRCVDPDGGAGHSPNVRALGRVLGDLSALGFDAEWHGLPASDVGAPHGRFRVFVLAYARGLRRGTGWDAVPGEAESGWASAVVGGRPDAPVGSLLPTPQVADMQGGHAARSGARSGELLLPGVAKAVQASAQWGEYEPAVRLWESITRPAPAPTLPDGKGGNHRLAAVFPEWMMGYSAGWVTDILDRNPAIKACGNGVVPQQAYAALGILWPRIRWEVAA